jgi:hypothetical protein
MGHVADGISSAVAKREPRALPTDGRTTSWLKIKNPTYSPAVGRPELFGASTLGAAVGRADTRP